MTRTGLRTPQSGRSPLDRLLSLFADVRAGEGATAVLMLLNIALLLICYSVIKTVREPLILLGGGAEVRSYAAAGQALLLMGFVPLYGWVASRVNRVRLLVGVTLFFIVCIELFASAVAAGVPFIGVAFFIWVGIFNISLVAQFWSFANDIYSEEAGKRLFPIIVIGMTAGAPLGSLAAAWLFRSGIAPQLILHVAAALLTVSVALYLWINRRDDRRTSVQVPPLSAAGGFGLVLGNPYLRLIAAVVVLLNVVNTTGEYLVARLLSEHVASLAAADPGFDKQAYIGAFSGRYQFWVNVAAFLIQAFLVSRLVKYSGLPGVLLALPLIALGGYAIVAAGVGFSVVRWIKTAENAMDYSVMNTARQLLWLPTTREEKYKAKQAIDTFFVRGGDLLSAGVVFVGASVLQLTVQQFAVVNVALTLVWLGTALLLVTPRTPRVRVCVPSFARAAACLLILGLAVAPASAQETREEVLAAQQAEKASRLSPYVPDALERRLERVDRVLDVMANGSIYPFIGSAFEGGGLTAGPGFRGRIGDTGRFDVHAGVSVKRYKTTDAILILPSFADGRMSVELDANWVDAPEVPFYGVGLDSPREDRGGYSFGKTTVGATTKFRAARALTLGAGLDAIQTNAGPVSGPSVATISPNYRRTRLFVEYDTRTSRGYTRTGGLYRVEWSDYAQTNAGAYSFQRLDIDARQHVPLLRENWVIALRALASTTGTDAGDDVPYYMMPELGGSKWLRGYPSWRFRDRNRLLLSGEYRWTAGSFVDMALFLDAGTLAPRFGDLGSEGFKTSYGIGLSVHTPTSTVTRIEVARTAEGMKLVFAFSPSF